MMPLQRRKPCSWVAVLLALGLRASAIRTKIGLRLLEELQAAQDSDSEMPKIVIEYSFQTDRTCEAAGDENILTEEECVGAALALGVFNDDETLYDNMRKQDLTSDSAQSMQDNGWRCGCMRMTNNAIFLQYNFGCAEKEVPCDKGCLCKKKTTEMFKLVTDATTCSENEYYGPIFDQDSCELGAQMLGKQRTSFNHREDEKSQCGCIWHDNFKQLKVVGEQHVGSIGNFGVGVTCSPDKKCSDSDHMCICAAAPPPQLEYRFYENFNAAADMNYGIISTLSDCEAAATQLRARFGGNVGVGQEDDASRACGCNWIADSPNSQGGEVKLNKGPSCLLRERGSIQGHLCKPLAPSKPGKYCVRIVTGDSDGDDGYLSVNIGDPSKTKVRQKFEKGDVVVDACYATPIQSVMVRNEEYGDMWAGRVEFSIDQGAKFHNMFCFDGCDASAVITSRIEVFGKNPTRGKDPSRLQCRHGYICQLVHGIVPGTAVLVEGKIGVVKDLLVDIAEVEFADNTVWKGDLFELEVA